MQFRWDMQKFANVVVPNMFSSSEKNTAYLSWEKNMESTACIVGIRIIIMSRLCF